STLVAHTSAGLADGGAAVALHRRRGAGAAAGQRSGRLRGVPAGGGRRSRPAADRVAPARPAVPPPPTLTRPGPNPPTPAPAHTRVHLWSRFGRFATTGAPPRSHRCTPAEPQVHPRGATGAPPRSHRCTPAEPQVHPRGATGAPPRSHRCTPAEPQVHYLMAPMDS